MSYSVVCECGQACSVTAGAAGTRIACTCGREVAVPPLHILRRQAGEAALSPELEIESLLQEGRVPDGLECRRCGATTDAVAHVHVECERPEEDRRVGTLTMILSFWFGWLTALLAFAQSGREAPVHGRNVSYRLPLRLCRGCTAACRDDALKDALRKEPVYGRLLAKYPHAKASIVGSG
jgi:hypothetical protein